MDEISETIKKNKEIAENFQGRESLTSFTQVKDLFEKLLPRLQVEFNIPFVWISIIKRPEAVTDTVAGIISLLKDHMNFIDETVFRNLVTSKKPVLANKISSLFTGSFQKTRNISSSLLPSPRSR